MYIRARKGRKVCQQDGVGQGRTQLATLNVAHLDCQIGVLGLQLRRSYLQNLIHYAALAPIFAAVDVISPRPRTTRLAELARISCHSTGNQSPGATSRFRDRLDHVPHRLSALSPVSDGDGFAVTNTWPELETPKSHIPRCGPSSLPPGLPEKASISPRWEVPFAAVT